VVLLMGWVACAVHPAAGRAQPVRDAGEYLEPEDGPFLFGDPYLAKVREVVLP
jgi:hypothetical protein